MKRKTRWYIMLALILFVVSGCEIDVMPMSPTVSPTVSAPVSVDSTPSPTPEVSVTPTSAPFAGLTTLTLWVPDFMPLYDEAGEATYLMEQIEAFNQTHRTVQVDVLVKKATGPGGLYDLLETGSQAAPEVLPDLLLLDEADLYKASNAALIQPMLESVTVPTSTYSLAIEATQQPTVSYAVPLLMDIEQTVYNPRLALTAPLSWTSVLSGGYSLLFPAAPPNDLAEDALLAAYLGSGGTIIDEAGEPFLDRAVLEDLYGFFGDLRAKEAINVQLVSDLPDATACWEAYQERQATLSVVPAAEYWNAENRIDAPGWIPTVSGKPYGLAHFWSVALVTQDPVRQDAALRLIDWLNEPERLTLVSQQVVMLPTNRETLALWGLVPEDLDFVDTLLETAALPPRVEEIDRPVRRALQAGLVLMLGESSATSDQAAAQALTVLRK